MDGFMQMPPGNAGGLMQFLDPATLAQNQADMERWRQNQALAQSLMQSQYIPNSGRAGAIGNVLQRVMGAIANNQQQGRLSDILEQQFNIQNAAASAKRQQDLADEQRKLQEEIYKAVQSERGKAQAQKEFAKAEFTGGGVFDPSTGGFTPNADWMKQQLDLKRAEAAITAANREGPADPFAKYKLAVQQGLLTPDQAKQGIQRELLGAGGNVPSGYRATATGDLEAIPGGPADPALAAKPKPLTEGAANALAKINNAIANAKEYQRRTVGPKGEFNDVASMLNDTPQLMNSAVQDMLYAKSGANAPAAEVAKAQAMYAPSRFLGIPTERDTTASAKIGNFIRDMERMRDQYQQGTTAEGSPEPQAFGASPGQTGTAPAPSKQPTQTAINPQTGQRIGLIDGQWVPL